jgi:hypothetical protein
MWMRTLLVGDVHGCSLELRMLLDKARPDRVFLAGDIFTKGPDPLGCWEIVRDAGARAVLGNHDAWLLRTWSAAPQASELPRGHSAAFRVLGDQPELRRWLGALPLVIEDERFILVHAGLNPERGLAGTTRDQALTLRRWPDDEASSNPLWWEVLHPGVDRRLVVYSHDARHGLADHRPCTLGLDTGCVYGGELTGYLVEEDQIVQVPALAVYKDVGRRRKGL